MTSMVPHHASHRVLHPRTSLADSEIVLLCTNTTEAHNAGQLTGLQYGRGCCSRPYAKGGIGNGALVQLLLQPFSEYVAGTRRVGPCMCVLCRTWGGIPEHEDSPYFDTWFLFFPLWGTGECSPHACGSNGQYPQQQGRCETQLSQRERTTQHSGDPARSRP